jgi:hypothetical protein
MQVRFKIFRGTFKSWEKLFQDAAAFASTLRGGRLIGISHSSDSEGVVTVWYWDRERPGA